MHQYIVWVEFKIRPGGMDAFMPLMLANARASLDLEPGCLCFDVLTPEKPEEAVALYEIYESKAAFQEHLASAHFAAFSSATSEMIVHKNVRTFHMVPNDAVQEGPAS